MPLRKRWKQTGLVGELLLLIGGLAAMAIPSYIDYQNRAKVSEGLALASGLKGVVVEYYVNYEGLPQGSAQEIHQKIGLAEPQLIRGRYVQSVNVDGEGAIHAQFWPEVFNDSAIVLEPSFSESQVTWRCKGDSEDPRFLRALPAACRK